MLSTDVSILVLILISILIPLSKCLGHSGDKDVNRLGTLNKSLKSIIKYGYVHLMISFCMAAAHMLIVETVSEFFNNNVWIGNV